MKIVVPVHDNNVDAATAMGVQFIQAMFPSLLSQLPS